MSSKYFIGFDIGASRVKAALVKDKKIIKSQLADLPGDLPGLLALLEKIFKELTDGLASEQIGGLGIDVPGFKNLLDKTFIVPNIKYLNGQDLAEIFAKKFGSYRILFEHDVHCFLLAEKEVGLARDFKNVFFLTAGSGVGGAFMINGQLVSGANGAAGEIGHTIIDLGQVAELEELAANKFIIKSLGIGSEEASTKAKEGDVKAQEVFEQLGQNLGVGIANIINVFDPEAVILSGGICDSQELILPGIQESIAKFVIAPAAQKTPVLFSQLGPFGGALGAALLFNQE